MKVKSFIDKVMKTGRYIVPVAVSAALVIWLFHKVDISRVIYIARYQCDFGWILAMMIVTMFSHVVRGVRWGIQLRAAGVPRMTVMKESVSIFGAYALNLLFPRLGEVWRTAYIARTERIPFMTVAGTVVGDRASDAVVVLALTALAFIVSRPAMERFIDHYALGREISDIVSNPALWIALVGVIGLFWGVLRYGRGNRYVENIRKGLHNVWQGFAVLFHLDGLGAYIVLTFGIWICYFMETYLSFFAFPFTRALVSESGMAWGLIPGLVVFVFGSMSMAVPSNGGLGAWNLAVMFALSLYGIADADGAAFSLVMWCSQSAMLVILGIFSAGYIMVTGRKKDAPAKPADASAE